MTNVLETLTDDKRPDHAIDLVATTRCQSAAEAIQVASQRMIDFLATGEFSAPDILYDAIEDVVAITAEGKNVPWPQPTWSYLEHVASLANAILSNRALWRGYRAQWDVRFTKLIALAMEQRPALLDPTPPAPKMVNLETLDELISQGVSDAQIARIYEWVDNLGHPDLMKVRLAKAGKVKPPETKTYEAHYDGPSREPHLGALDHCLDMFEEGTLVATEPAAE